MDRLSAQLASSVSLVFQRGPPISQISILGNRTKSFPFPTHPSSSSSLQDRTDSRISVSLFFPFQTCVKLNLPSCYWSPFPRPSGLNNFSVDLDNIPFPENGIPPFFCRSTPLLFPPERLLVSSHLTGARILLKIVSVTLLPPGPPRFLTFLFLLEGIRAYEDMKS